MEEIFSNVKIVILGTPSVGKTSLRRCYLGENFRKNYIETIGSDFSFTTLDLGDVEIGLSLWDIAGQERFLEVHPLFYKGSYGCIVVYSIVDRSTFDQVQNWVDRFISESNRDHVPIMVIGNKLDLVPNFADVVSLKQEEGLVAKLSQQYPNHKFSHFRTSAKTGKHVKEGINTFAKIVYSWITSNYSNLRSSNSYSDDIDNNIPGAYAIAMNQITGPMLLASSPPVNSNSVEYTGLSTSTIKLVASLDFNDVISQSSIISTFPWVKPHGDFYYIAFVIDNTNARGNNELFIVGVNIDRTLKDPVNGIKGVLDGLLFNSVNEINHVLSEHQIDLITNNIDLEKKEVSEIIDKLEIILEKLRQKVHNSLKRWYNIP